MIEFGIYAWIILASTFLLCICVYFSLSFFRLEEVGSMGRGVSCGGGQSSLGYLFGSGQAPKAAPNNPRTFPTEAEAMPSPKPAALPVDIPKDIPAGILSSSTNNHMRADGQNAGNFITVLLCLLLM